MREKLIIFTIPLLFTFGCDKSLTFDVEFEGEKLVVFSILTPNDPVSVYVSKSQNPYHSGVFKYESYIKDAVVTVLENGILHSTLTYNELKFAYIGDSSLLPVVGRNYQLIVETQQFNRLISDPVVIPDSVQLDIVVDNTGTEGGFGMVSNITFTFQDNAEEDNAYGYDLTRDFLRFGGSSGYGGHTWRVDETFDEKCNFYSASLSDFSDGSIFNDLCINGLSVTLKLTAQVIGSGQFAFRFYFFEPVLFEYYKSFSRLNEAGVGYLDPLRVPSNIEGGYGMIGASNYIERVVFLGSE